MVHRSTSLIIAIGLLFLLLTACKKQTRQNIPEDSIHVEVSHSSGSLWEEAPNYLGLPANLAEPLNSDTTATHYLVLAPPLPAGRDLYVDPIGVLRLNKNSRELNIVLSMPIDTTLQTIRISNMDDFGTIHNSEKWIIEQWFLNHAGLGEVTMLQWEPKEFVKNHLQH